MFFAFPFPLVLALSPVTPDHQSIEQMDVSVAAEVRRLESVLDPDSADALRSNQQAWERRVQALDDQLAILRTDKTDDSEELARIGSEVRQQRLSFLADIKAIPAPDLRGGWTDGTTDVLFDTNGKDRAKLVTITDDGKGKSAICVVNGAFKASPDGLTISPDQQGDQPVQLRRFGITLAIEAEQPSASGMPPYCQTGGALSGKYFRIEGAEDLLPWLLH
ncbi:hypothetical protein NT2_02_04480 [Caenibius tardaugens NBRC 16725]|uniref:Lysozyme inhibitor LprI N-terminal domain-containing protein n=1 Tax=Caenibius tardaugens NBRC 16725 TaxID=1219035 RepID=U2YJ15_9SPHN|nr:hypothetical protein [Caenibius tardaugens]AZI34837.1 hypothetical protein EGO55_01785 [Caenibius tardaugens NBRC 16725]GAD48365.1 hypothetical protein NT2_02_04480 [Caenibius tardaugens NBRC 16725]